MTKPEFATRPGAPESFPVLARWGRRGVGIVAAVAALVMLLIGAIIGLVVSGSSAAAPSLTDSPGDNSVDAGFARDMIVHHAQGVVLAHFGEIDSTNEQIRGLAYDIALTQQAQIGQMQGWLALWDLNQVTGAAPMSWMTGAGGMVPVVNGTTTSIPGTDPAAGVIMPGMATDAEITKLKTLRGNSSDVYFLQLMLRHHQGGAPMMVYAAAHAGNALVRNFAAKMAESQGNEIDQMTALLKTLKASPLPAPDTSMAGMTMAPTTS